MVAGSPWLNAGCCGFVTRKRPIATRPPLAMILADLKPYGRATGAVPLLRKAPVCYCYKHQTLRAAIMRSMIGWRITSMAKPILPPGTTMVLRRDMKESWIMLSR